jgi:predicted nuclease of predicted toxin-antitoxin system
LKLLFDQNLSHRLCRILADVFPETQQVRSAGLDRATDEAIWTFAQEQGFAIVTLDSDFADLAALRGFPPKVIWLRFGNQPTEVVASLLRNHADLIAGFDDDPDAACMELY